MKDIILTKLDPILHGDFKTACAYFNISMRQVLIKHMQNIVSDYRRDRREFDKPKIYKKVKGKK